ncbi:unnamed protein product, partial [Closterium sp. Naga37s-1]
MRVFPHYALPPLTTPLIPPPTPLLTIPIRSAPIALPLTHMPTTFPLFPLPFPTTFSLFLTNHPHTRSLPLSPFACYLCTLPLHPCAFLPPLCYFSTPVPATTTGPSCLLNSNNPAPSPPLSQHRAFPVSPSSFFLLSALLLPPLLLPPQALPVSSTAANPPPHPHPHFMEPTPFLTSTPSFRSVAALGTLPPPSSSSPLSPSQTSLARRRTPSSLGNISEEEAREERLGAPSLTGRGGKRGGPIGVFSIEGEEAEERGKAGSVAADNAAAVAAAAAAAATNGSVCNGGMEGRVAGESGCVEGTGKIAGGERGGGGGREAERGEGRGKVQWVGSSGGGLVGKDERGRGEVGEGEGKREEEEEEDEEEGMSTVSMSVLAGTIDGRESVIDEDEEEGEVGSAVGDGGGEDEWEMGPAGAMCGEDDLGEVVSGTGKTGSTIENGEVFSGRGGAERRGVRGVGGAGGAGGTGEATGRAGAGGPAVVQLRFESEEQLRVAAVVVRELMSKIQRCLESSPPALQSPLSARRSTVPMRQHK